MKQTLTDHPNATIYQYKHVKRIIVRKELIFSYLACALILLGTQFLVYDMFGLFSWLISFVAVQIVHLIIILITFISVNEAVDRKWMWSILPPWIGFKPSNDIRFTVFRRVHTQLFWLGLIVISLLYPWIPLPIMISLVFWHIWLLSPKILLNLLLKKITKKNKNGILRIQNHEVNLFQP